MFLLTISTEHLHTVVPKAQLGSTGYCGRQVSAEPEQGLSPRQEYHSRDRAAPQRGEVEFASLRVCKHRLATSYQWGIYHKLL